MSTIKLDAPEYFIITGTNLDDLTLKLNDLRGRGEVLYMEKIINQVINDYYQVLFYGFPQKGPSDE